MACRPILLLNDLILDQCLPCDLAIAHSLKRAATRSPLRAGV